MTVHQSPITVNGWQGSGYSVLDPETGVGAYQISGGASGGFLNKLKFWTGFIISFIDNQPIRGLIVDGLLAGVGVIFGLLTNGYDLLTKCASSGFALGLIAVLTFVAIVFEALLIMSGIGFFAGLLLGLLIGRLEDLVINYYIQNNPLCTRS